MYVGKGKISAVSGKTQATIVPLFSAAPVSAQLTIPFFLSECLKVGMEVVYAQFPDNTGVILARMDGEWNHQVDGGVKVLTGDVEVLSGGLNVEGTVTAEDLTTGVVSSYNAHAHDCPGGTTSGPK